MTGSGLLAGLLPAAVSTVQTQHDLDERLLVSEEPFVATAVAGRRREFATGRACARRALAGIGVAPVALLPGPRGAPVWPAGVVGSLTHCSGLCAVAVSRDCEVLGLGIDAEVHAPLPDGVLDVVARAAEQERLASLGPGAAWDRVLFSAKESVYKVWSPATGTWLAHEEVDVRIGPGGTFTARLLRPGLVLGGRPLDTLAGRWAVDPDHVVTAIAVLAAGAS
ncbi:MAG: 4'-phosphopantetheinyl transferase superfamily protein [Nocardioides sp.]|nr:4'-phosphopantetheinyl transferase superfamily protein [Nocardioides sp.]